MFLFYVLIFFKKGDTLQGGTLFKGGHYLRKYSIFVEIVGVLMNQLRISKDFKKECKRGHANELETLLSATHVSRELPHNVTK